MYGQAARKDRDEIDWGHILVKPASKAMASDGPCEHIFIINVCCPM